MALVNTRKYIKTFLHFSITSCYLLSLQQILTKSESQMRVKRMQWEEEQRELNDDQSIICLFVWCSPTHFITFHWLLGAWIIIQGKELQPRRIRKREKPFLAWKGYGVFEYAWKKFSLMTQYTFIVCYYLWNFENSVFLSLL